MEACVDPLPLLVAARNKILSIVLGSSAPLSRVGCEVDSSSLLIAPHCIAAGFGESESDACSLPGPASNG